MDHFKNKDNILKWKNKTCMIKHYLKLQRNNPNMSGYVFVCHLQCD